MSFQFRFKYCYRVIN